MSAQARSTQEQSPASAGASEIVTQAPTEAARAEAPAQVSAETTAQAPTGTPRERAPSLISSGSSLDLEERVATKTRYMEMLLQYDQVPRSHNIIVAISTWLLLVGFVLAPVTFTNMAVSVKGIVHIGVLWVSAVCCVVGGAGCSLMWFRWRRNYIWLLNNLFQPLALNAAASLLATVVNVYSVHQGVWSTPAKLASGVTGGYTAVTGLLFLIYNLWALERERKSHERAFNPEQWERAQMARRNESFADKLQRKLREKPTVTTGRM
ncbi:hypothetical protein DV735_g4808, partial [Chaetothyriales sp. CBS 134920]